MHGGKDGRTCIGAASLFLSGSIAHQSGNGTDERGGWDRLSEGDSAFAAQSGISQTGLCILPRSGFLTAGALVVDFFDDTKVPISYIDMTKAFEYVKDKGVEIDSFDSICFGAYGILGKQEELVVDAAVCAEPKKGSETSIDRFEYFRRYAHPSGAVGFYFARPEDHAGMTGALESQKQREKLCEKGAELIRRIVDLMDMSEYMEALKYVDEETRQVILPKYEDILPRNRNF